MKSVKSVSEAITAPVLLLVEGQDEAYLLRRMCQHWLQGRAENIDIECVGGTDRFPAAFRALTVRSKGPLRVVGVIADSEENPQATAQRWKDLIAEVQPVVNCPCEKLQVPNERTPGAFEALVLGALGDNPVVGCATTFRDCVAPHVGARTKAQLDKIAVQAWLSAWLGRAYGNVFKAQEQHGQPLLNYDHPAFAPIRAFLEGLLAQVETQPHEA